MKKGQKNEAKDQYSRTPAPEHVVLILVDGIGLPDGRWSESVYADCPDLIELFENHSVPLDPSLGVPGTPQSATGQTAILTGINAAALMNAHIEGFPNRQLRGIIEKENVFTKLQKHGISCTFANAYVVAPGNELPMHCRSVTTVATLAAFGGTRNVSELLSGKAVFHDLTRATLPGRGITGVPRISEAEAAKDLLRITHAHRFTLFEYFLTDHAGHRGTIARKKSTLASLNSFLAALCTILDRKRDLLLIVSDHGNIEAVDRRGHSTNPVPWIAVGCCAEQAQEGCTSLLDVTPRILQHTG